MKQWFLRHWTLGNETEITERQEANEVIPMISPVYYMERVSRPQDRERNSVKAC